MSFSKKKKKQYMMLLNNYRRFNFNKINQYQNYGIEISKYDYEKLNKCINYMKEKYAEKIHDLYKLEKENSIKYDFDSQKKFVIMHKKIVINIVKDIIDYYHDELINLDILLLSGSFPRGTNIISSDLDLHFFYKNKNYNYVYEEIVCFIISNVLNKSRDYIDPTFIYNLDFNKKKYITDKMDKGNLDIVIKSEDNLITYSYKEGKKRRFYIQYNNSRNINKLFNYLNEQMMINNEEWCHTFEIIKGKNKFNKLYKKLYNKEKKIINKTYINKKINKLINNISKYEIIKKDDNISTLKKYYQMKPFELMYEYISIIRFNMLNHNKNIMYCNLFEIYDKVNDNSKDVINDIYNYIWGIEKLSIYCYENNINYGLHTNNIIKYSTKELDNLLNRLKKSMINDLNRMGDLYG